MIRSNRFLPVLLLLLLQAGCINQHPEQPEGGPGGYYYPHNEVAAYGPYWADPEGGQSDQYKYYLYEPADPTPSEAPVVLFLHGYLALEPYHYIDWIEHIVRKGYVVVWVKYDKGLTPLEYLTGNALLAYRDALDRLENGTDVQHVQPEVDAQGRILTGYTCHSAGCVLAANLAALSQDPEYGIPVPYALCLIEPGILGVIPTYDYSYIAPETKIILLAADEDDTVCKSSAVGMWNMMEQVPEENMDFLFYRSDRSFPPWQLANHYFPNNTGYRDSHDVDARDYYITFKLSVALLNCAFRGTDCQYALGHGSVDQLYMGKWKLSLPVLPLPVLPMEYIEDPNSLESTCEDP